MKSDDLLPIPAYRFNIFNALAWMRLRLIFVLGNEWVGILLRVQISERMVDLSVLRFICSDVHQQVPHRLVSLRHIPVSNSNFGCLQSLPSWQSAFIDILDCESVRLDSFLFDVADEAMAGLG